MGRLRLRGPLPLCMTSHDEICQEVCDVGQQRGVRVKFLARLPCNARRHQANSLAWYKGRDCLRGKDQWCPAFCRLWLHGKQLPPSSKSQPFPHIGEILALSLLEGNKWHKSICLFEVKQDLRVCSSSTQKWSCEFFWLNPRPCCGFQMSSWNCLCWDFQDYTLQLGFCCNFAFSPHVQCHCRNKQQITVLTALGSPRWGLFSQHEWATEQVDRQSTQAHTYLTSGVGGTRLIPLAGFNHESWL